MVGFAYFAVLAGVFVTAFYSFRMIFPYSMGEQRFGKHDDAHHHEHDGDHDDEWKLRTTITMVWLPAEASRNALGCLGTLGRVCHPLSTRWFLY